MKNEFREIFFRMNPNRLFSRNLQLNEITLHKNVEFNVNDNQMEKNRIFFFKTKWIAIYSTQINEKNFVVVVDI